MKKNNYQAPAIEQWLMSAECYILAASGSYTETGTVSAATGAGSDSENDWIVMSKQQGWTAVGQTGSNLWDD